MCNFVGCSSSNDAIGWKPIIAHTNCVIVEGDRLQRLPETALSFSKYICESYAAPLNRERLDDLG